MAFVNELWAPILSGAVGLIGALFGYQVLRRRNIDSARYEERLEKMLDLELVRRKDEKKENWINEKRHRESQRLAMELAQTTAQLSDLRQQTTEQMQRFVVELDKRRRELEQERAAIESRLASTPQRWLEMNRSVIEGQNPTTSTSGLRPLPITEFVKNLGVNTDLIKVDPTLVFVLIPFNPNYDDVWRAIKEGCARVGLRAMRGDERFVETNLLSHILLSLLTARVVIAVLDGRNPNVFYELGVAHSCDKQVILVATELTGIPFDLQSRQIVLYESPEKLEKLLPEALGRIAFVHPNP